LDQQQPSKEKMESLKKPTNKPCPREKANFFSYWIFWWVLPVFFKGRKRELLLDDLYEPLKAHKSGKFITQK
jgi:hypothetical protein